MAHRFWLPLLLCAIQAGLITPVARGDTIDAPEVMPREKWLSSSEPCSIERMQPHQERNIFRGLVIHHTETLFRLWQKYSTEQKMQNYHRIHLANKQRHREDIKGQFWGGFAYHYFIDV